MTAQYGMFNSDLDREVTGWTLIRATASDDGLVARVELYADGVFVDRDLSSPYIVQWNTWEVPNGAHSLVARAWDAMGNMGESEPISVNVLDPNPPSITIESPTAGEAVSGVYHFEASVTDDGVVRSVEFALQDSAANETPLGSKDTQPYGLDWNSGTVANGAYTLVARARDGGGNVGTASVSFEVKDLVPPAVTVLSPYAGDVVAAQILIRAEASDAGVVRTVELLVDGTVVATAVAPPYAATWDTTAVANGDHAVAARAYDGTGNVQTSAPVSVVVRNPGAVRDDALGVPLCADVRAFCHTGTLVDGRGVVGPETGAPNTLFGACADGNQGAYHTDESVDFVGVESLDGAPFTAGRPARLTVRAWIGSADADRLDLYTAADVKSPAWTYLATLVPGGTGRQTLSAQYTLPWGKLQAVRAALRHGGTPAPCASGLYDDRDDLAFAVALPDDTTPPAVAIISPAPGENVQGIFPVQVSASDDVLVSYVEVEVGGALAGIATAAPYIVYWDTSGLAAGAYVLTATAHDGAGNTGTSTPVSVTVGDVVPPAVAIVSPAPGATLPPGPTALAADVVDAGGIARVEFRVDGALVGTAVAPPYQVIWNAGSVANGAHALDVTAFDLTGNLRTASVAFQTQDGTAPAVAITRPADGDPVTGSVLVEAAATDAGLVARVEFFADGERFAVDTSAPYSVAWSTAGLADGERFAVDTSAPYSVAWSTTGLAAGSHTLVAKAYDAAGNEGVSPTDTVAVLDTQPPVAAITSPIPGETVSGPVTVAMTAADDVGVRKVVLLVDGTAAGEDPTAPYAVAWDTTAVPDGTHQLVARAEDGAGNFSVSSPVSVVVANNAKAVYDRQLKAPRCSTVGALCSSGALLVGRGNLGPEPKQPNTISSSCADGQNGTFHVDESSDAITVATVDGSPFAPGKTVRVDVKVWAGSAFDKDSLDLYHSADARSLVWTHVATIKPAAAGPQVLSTTFTLPAGSSQAVRASFRYGGTAAPCTTGSFDDHDDLAFAVGLAF